VHAQSAELQVLLEGVSLPASKDELIRYAREQEDAGTALQLLGRLPRREYRTLDEVGEMLAPVQAYSAGESPLPHEESDLPPGGDDYLNPAPVPGGVRPDAPSANPPQQAIEEQTKTQKKQQRRQKKQLES
jgi:uncharacterized protein DUF2795